MTDNEIVSLLRETLGNQTQVFRDGFHELQTEMAATRKQVLAIAILGMVLQAAMVGVGLHYSAAGQNLSVTPSSTVEPTPPVTAPLGWLDPASPAQATTDGTAPLDGLGYGVPDSTRGAP